MRLDVHVYLHTDPPSPDPRIGEIAAGVEAIKSALVALSERMNLMSGKIDQELADLETAVTENTSTDQSAIMAIEGLAAQIQGLVEDATDLDTLKAAVTAKAAAIRTSSAALAAAIVAIPPTTPPATP